MKSNKSYKLLELVSSPPIDLADMPPELKVKKQNVQCVVNHPNHSQITRDFRQFSSLSNAYNDSTVYKLTNWPPKDLRSSEPDCSLPNSRNSMVNSNFHGSFLRHRDTSLPYLQTSKSKLHSKPASCLKACRTQKTRNSLEQPTRQITNDQLQSSKSRDIQLSNTRSKAETKYPCYSKTIMKQETNTKTRSSKHLPVNKLNIAFG